MIYAFSTTFTTLQQGKHAFMEFTMTATQLSRLAQPIRYSEDPERGVQRELNEAQVMGLNATMMKGGAIPAIIVVNLIGTWIVEGNQIYGEVGASEIELLDGQQRTEAARRLIASGFVNVTDGYSYKIMAVLNADDATRRELFLTQTEALRISRGHTLAVRGVAGQFKNTGEEHAYAMAQALNMRMDSVLYERVHAGDLVLGARGKRMLPSGYWISQSALMTALRQLTGNKSAIASMTMEQKTQFAVDLLDAADKSYPTAFGPQGALRTSFGISALFLLATKQEGSFRTMLRQNGFTKAEMLRLFELVPRFQWGRSERGVSKYYTPSTVVERFNALLGPRLQG